MAFIINKAERRKSKLRLGIVGSSGSGKTYSALLIGFGIGGKICVIDTESESANLYEHLGEYFTLQLEKPFSPQRYIEAIKTAEKEDFDTIVIDSLSHAWEGEGGELDMHDKASRASKSGNSYMAWREITPWHNALINAMITSKSHIIATMRAKTEYILDVDDKGKSKPKKVGMKPIQREGMDYEFTTVFDVSNDGNIASVSKDRTDLFRNECFRPSIETGKKLKEWLESGKDVPPKPEPAVTQPIAQQQAQQKTYPPKAVAPVPVQKEKRKPDVTMNVSIFSLMKFPKVMQITCNELGGEGTKTPIKCALFNTHKTYASVDDSWIGKKAVITGYFTPGKPGNGESFVLSKITLDDGIEANPPANLDNTISIDDDMSKITF